MDRRILIKIGAPALILRLISTYRVASAEQSATIVWNVPRDQVQTLREALNFEGQITPKSSSVLDTRGTPLLFILAGTVGISALARALVGVYKDLRYGGIVVTTRDGKINITNDVRLSSGTMIVYDNQGLKVYEVTQNADADIGHLAKSLSSISSQKPLK